MSSTLDTLNTIYEQIKNKEEWGQGALYKDGKICLTGRLYAINDVEKKESARSRLYEALENMREPPDLAAYNDSHSHSEVVQLVVKAIALEKKAVGSISKLSSVMRIS